MKPPSGGFFIVQPDCSWERGVISLYWLESVGRPYVKRVASYLEP